MAPRPRSSAGVELAYERIRGAIVENRYEPGQHLVEQRIAEEFELSRTPVREALRRLEAEGLVVTQRHRGAIVRPISPDEVHDLYELRARLESYAAELAADRADDDELTAIRAAAEAFGEACRQAAGDETVRAIDAANRQLHERIAAASHHGRLVTMLGRTVDVPLVFRAFKSFGPDELARSDLFHHLLADAIAAGDGRRAARLMGEHIAQGRDVVVAGMRASLGDDLSAGSWH